MYNLFLNIMLILSIFSIFVIVIQPTRTQSSSNAFLGGSELFGRTKVRGFEAVLIKVTVFCLATFFVLALVLAKLSA